MYQILQTESVNDMALHERSHYSECDNIFSNCHGMFSST